MPTHNPHEFAQQHPHPGDDPIARLRHTLDIYTNQPDEEWITRATIGMYGPGEVTGLTWGDLRAIADQIGA